MRPPILWRLKLAGVVAIACATPMGAGGLVALIVGGAMWCLLVDLVWDTRFPWG